MQCLRIVSHNVETGERVRNTRIPVAVVKVAARFLPVSLLAKVDERLTTQVARDILDAVPKMIDGWETSNRGELTIDQLPDRVLLVAFESPVSRLHCRSSSARIASVKAYAQEAV